MKLQTASLLLLILCGSNNANLLGANSFLQVHHRHRGGRHLYGRVSSSNTVVGGPLHYKSDPVDDPPPYPPLDDITDGNDDATTSSSSSTIITTPTPRGRKQRRSFLHQLDRFLTILQNTQSHLNNHTFLSGNFAPVLEEHVQVPVMVVEGAIPDGIDGAFCRNGPNPIMAMQRKRYHWVSEYDVSSLSCAQAVFQL